MRRSRRLEPISQVVQSAERLAARALTACQRRVAAQEARLAELRAFRTEYQQRFQEAGRAGMNARQLQDFCEFLTRLDTTAEHQSAVAAFLNKTKT